MAKWCVMFGKLTSYENSSDSYNGSGNNVFYNYTHGNVIKPYKIFSLLHIVEAVKSEYTYTLNFPSLSVYAKVMAAQIYESQIL